MSEQRRRNFTEKTVSIFNPMPSISTEEVVERAGLSDVMDRADEPFLLIWTYGAKIENIVLHSGDHMVLKESEAQEFLSSMSEQGACRVEDMDDAEELHNRTLEGLRRARDFWAFRGTRQLVNIRKNLEIGKDELDDYKVEHWRIYYNEALKDFCVDAIKDLTKKSEEPKRRVQTTKENVA
jgi:hypothetical protein